MIRLRQKTTPNVNVNAIPGYCLKYVDDGVNAPARQPTAQMAYERQKVHGNIRTSPLPVGLWVPIFFSLNNGQYAGYGHVAWAFNHGDWVEIHDSEVHSGARGVYRSLAQIMAWFSALGIVYLGWSLWVDGVQIIEEYDDTPKPVEIEFIPMDNSRVLIAGVDVHKFDPKTKSYSNEIAITQGDYRIFIDKFFVGNDVFLRTKHDYDRGTKLGINYANMVDVPDPSVMAKRLTELN